ncbi:hypothetical protein SAMN06265182_1486 [Persephonella hydrogeniphila]|uniref:Uncharacterized protein n=1 Tax=Persephonella hydrogeniphila TaxID=198703 RepID=A0A285NJM2_9AQUI|nr:hypothetical protein [Persephonella hydrogeniphila]SNZ09133.1 hypothetical protein SAMN06265182_1486 [Persephonella hydrogeniphila]
MGEKKPWDYVIKFLLNPQNNDEGYWIFYGLFKREFKKYDLLEKNLNSLDLFHDFLIHIIFKNQKWKLNPTIYSKIDDKVVSYIYASLHNFLKTKYREFLAREYSKDEITEYEIDEVSPVILDLIIEAKEIKEKIISSFNQRDIRTICFLLLGDRKYINEEISDDALYQRKSRMKKRLKEFVKENGFSLEGFAYFQKYILKSEICDKLG